MTKLSQVNISRFFLLNLLTPLCQRREPRHPNEKSAGAKEGGVATFRGTHGKVKGMEGIRKFRRD